MAPTRKQRLFNSPRGGPKTKGIKYATAKNARKSIQLIKGQDKTRRKRIAMRMYYRAKFHKYQTPGMRAAMKVWKNYIDKIPGVQRGGKCITIREVANVLQKIYPMMDVREALNYIFDLDTIGDDIFSDELTEIFFTENSPPMNPSCLTLTEATDIIHLSYVHFNENGELRNDLAASEAAINVPHELVRQERLQPYALSPIVNEQVRLQAIKNLGKKRGLPENINSELAKHLTGLPGNINSQVAQLNEERQKFGESLAPRRNTRRKPQRGGKCITMEEVATIVQEMYPDADLEDDLDFSYVIESSVLLGTITDPDCITFQEVVHILQRYYRFFTQEEESAENALNRLQAHVLPRIIKKQNRLGAIKNLGKKRGLPAQINSELASYITGLPGNINSQLAQLNENKQRFGVSLAPRRNTRRR